MNLADLLIENTPYSIDETDPRRIDWFNDTDQFIFFTNNYLNWIAESLTTNDPVIQSRLEVVQNVTNALVDRISINNQDPDQRYNVGLMRFSTDADGGMVLQEVADIGENRDDMVTAINGLDTTGSTPLAETMYEAYQYYRGAPVTYGTDSLPVPSTAGSQTNGVYDSPTISSCQKNYVVLLAQV